VIDNLLSGVYGDDDFYENERLKSTVDDIIDELTKNTIHIKS
jgi:hypothetical protein